jgi:hypothetical protein
MRVCLRVLSWSKMMKPCHSTHTRTRTHTHIFQYNKHTHTHSAFHKTNKQSLSVSHLQKHHHSQQKKRFTISGNPRTIHSKIGPDGLVAIRAKNCLLMYNHASWGTYAYTLSVCVCMHVYTLALHTYIRMYATYINTRIHACIHINILSSDRCRRLLRYVYMYACMCVCVCVCVCVYIHAYIHTYIHT